MFGAIITVPGINVSLGDQSISRAAHFYSILTMAGVQKTGQQICMLLYLIAGILIEWRME